MRKHRNLKQDKILLKFMSTHPSIARGFCKGDKVNQEAKWKEIADVLNNAGPPIKEVSGWKKTWIDWKISIKRKLNRNIEDKYEELSNFERRIYIICDFDNLHKRYQTGEFGNEASNQFQSPISSPNLTPEPNKKRKHEGLRECFLEALTQSSSDSVNCGVEIKEEKQDDSMENSAYDTNQHYQSIDTSYSLTSAAENRINDIPIKNLLEDVPENLRSFREENNRELIDSVRKTLNGVDLKLDQLNKKYDKLIELKMAQLEEMRRDREERRRHNLEIEKYNSVLLAVKSEKETYS